MPPEDVASGDPTPPSFKPVALKLPPRRLRRGLRTGRLTAADCALVVAMGLEAGDYGLYVAIDGPDRPARYVRPAEMNDETREWAWSMHANQLREVLKIADRTARWRNSAPHRPVRRARGTSRMHRARRVVRSGATSRDGPSDEPPLASRPRPNGRGASACPRFGSEA
jgi:hypothetical protein